MARRVQGRAERLEWLKCLRQPAYFLDRYGWVYDATARAWLRFRLWPAQVGALDALAQRRLLVVLKARQLGLSWLVTGFALWLMLFRPAATVLLFSRRDDEAVKLLARLRGMYSRLPAWLQAQRETTVAAHEWGLSNGSTALAFPTTGGRSYTATMAVVDEADFAGDLGALLSAVKPTVDAGGRLVLVSTVDKSEPESEFKRLYWAGKAGEGGWSSLFLAWSARPDRDAAWYADKRADVLARAGFLDELYQEYPATDLEALAGRTADVRIPAAWLARCADVGTDGAAGERAATQGRPYPAITGPALPGLAVWGAPAAGQAYVIGADPAEGNPQSDESAACILDADGVQVAELAGRFDPVVFAGYLARLSEHYGGAPVLVERNNHGHAVLLALGEIWGVWCLAGLDEKPGWLTTAKSKALAWDKAAERLAAGECLVRDGVTLRQLGAVKGSDLQAPDGQHDDRAMAFVLALAGLEFGGVATGATSAVVPAVDLIAEVDRGGF